jgi:hypothetical protein
MMSDDESTVTILSVVTWGVTWFLWYVRLGSGPRLRRSHKPRLVAALALPLSLAVVLSVLLRWSASDVRDSREYLFLYLALGAAWIGLASCSWTWLGLSERDDVIERGNLPVAVAFCGLSFGVGLCYAGGNIGDGPGWWVVVFSSGVATALWYVAWIALEWRLHVSEALTIDRDLAAGLRLGSWGAASGLLLGRAAAGNWVSATDTLADFARNGWPALPLLGLAFLLEHRLRPTPEAPQRGVIACGVVPGALYLALAFCWVASRGAWA